MIPQDLFFFCSTCHQRSAENPSRYPCTLAHQVKTYPKGTLIARQGDLVKHLFLLSKGKVRTEMLSDSGIALPIEEISAPYPLAAAFLFADNNRFPVEVIALEEVEILLISRATIEEQMRTCVGFLRGFMAFNANRTEFLSERLKFLSQKTIKGKIAYYLLKIEKGGCFELDRSIADLADYMSVERPSLSRAFSELIRDGIIELKNGKGKIKQFNKLKG